MILCPNHTLADLLEFNLCHLPGGPGGGQFCSAPDSGGGGGPSTKTKALEQAHYIRPGQSFDIVAAAQAGQTIDSRVVVAGYPIRKSRRFLFNPITGEMILGVAMGVRGREQSHAEAFNTAIPMGADVLAHAKRYDKFTVRGHIQDNAMIKGQQSTVPVAIVIDRILPGRPGKLVIDQLADLAARMTGWQAPKETPILSLELARGEWTTLATAFPEVFPKARRKKAA